MTLAVRASSKASSNSASTLGVAAPTGTVAGDIAIVVAAGNTTGNLADNNGSTPFTESYTLTESTEGSVMSIFARAIQSGDPSTYSFTNTVTDRFGEIAISFSGGDTASIFDVAPGAGNTTAFSSYPTSMSAPSITTLTDGAIHVCGAILDSGGAAFNSWPSGYTVAQTITASGQRITLAWKVITTAGSTGAQSFGNDTGVCGYAFSFAIKPGSSGTTINVGNIAFTLTKHDASINAAKNIAAGNQAMTLTPHDATVNFGHNIAVGNQAMTMVGHDPAINATKNISAQVVAMTLTPHDAVVTYTPVGATVINATLVAMTLTPYDATVNFTPQQQATPYGSGTESYWRYRKRLADLKAEEERKRRELEAQLEAAKAKAEAEAKALEKAQREQANARLRTMQSARRAAYAAEVAKHQELLEQRRAEVARITVLVRSELDRIEAQRMQLSREIDQAIADEYARRRRVRKLKVLLLHS